MAFQVAGIFRVLLASLAWLTAASFTERALAQSSSTAAPADQVWVAPSPTVEGGWYPEGIAIRRGRIVAFDDRQLRLVPGGGEAETSVAAERVLWIEPAARSDDQRAALDAFRDGRYGEALRPLIELVQAHPPVWRQQWFLMAAAQAAWRASRPSAALELVSQLDQRGLPPLVLAWLPVAWRSHRPGEAARVVASEKLSAPSPAVRLVAASWLLSSADRHRARQVLEQLTKSEVRPRIARLAESVLWRAAEPDEALRSAAEWESRLDSLPLVLQVGPSIALSEKLRAAGADRAARRLRWSLELAPPHPHPDLRATAAAAE